MSEKIPDGWKKVKLRGQMLLSETDKRTFLFLYNGQPQMPLPQYVGSEGILQKFCRDCAKNNKNEYFNLSLNKVETIYRYIDTLLLREKNK